MWSKLDDALLTHPKTFLAGELLGRNGPGLALGMFCLGLLWTNKHLTDGRVPASVVKTWTSHFSDPQKVADALVTAGLWEQATGGYLIHDFHHHNFHAEDIQSGRAERADIRARAGRVGGLKSGLTRRRQAEMKHKAEREAKTKQVG